MYVPPTGPLTNPGLSSNLQATNFSDFMGRFFPALVSLLFMVGALIFIFVFFLGAIQWINSGSDKGSLEAARGRVTQAIIGLAILFSLFAIVNLIEVFFGTDITYFDLNTLRI